MTMGENEDEDEDERERDGTPHYLPFLLTIDGRDFVIIAFTALAYSLFVLPLYLKAKGYM